MRNAHSLNPLSMLSGVGGQTAIAVLTHSPVRRLRSLTVQTPFLIRYGEQFATSLLIHWIETEIDASTWKVYDRTSSQFPAADLLLEMANKILSAGYEIDS